MISTFAVTQIECFYILQLNISYLWLNNKVQIVSINSNISTDTITVLKKIVLQKMFLNVTFHSLKI